MRLVQPDFMDAVVYWKHKIRDWIGRDKYDKHFQSTICYSPKELSLRVTRKAVDYLEGAAFVRVKYETSST